jgi:alkylated DNA repair protein (DNA oxidative demethylase)
MRSGGVLIADFPEPLEAAVAKCLAPGLTLFRRYLDDAARQALAGETAEAVLQAPWFLPRMPRSGKAFSVKMTNCGCLGRVSDRDEGYHYQATHPFTGNAWPAIPLAVLNLTYGVPSPSIRIRRRPAWSISTIFPHGWACIRIATRRIWPRRWSRSRSATIAVSVTAVCGAAKLERRSGDILVMDSAARLMFHGVEKIFPGSCSLLPGGGRINLTLRRVTRPSPV